MKLFPLALKIIYSDFLKKKHVHSPSTTISLKYAWNLFCLKLSLWWKRTTDKQRTISCHFIRNQYYDFWKTCYKFTDGDRIRNQIMQKCIEIPQTIVILYYSKNTDHNRKFPLSYWAVRRSHCSIGHVQ